MPSSAVSAILASMKTALDHLPEQKQQYVKAIRDIILNDVEQLIEKSTGKKQLSKIKHIILFGSYAKGTYVDDPTNGYISDYDILVTLNNGNLIDEYELWRNIEEKADRRVHSPVKLIVHTAAELGQWLSEGQYFFSDIQREGIYLYNSNGKGLPEPKNLSNEELKPIAEKHFAQWFQNAESFLRHFGYAMNDKDFKKSAFELHQATERYYHTLLLTLTNYRPKTHDLKRLHLLTIQYAPKIEAIFPQNTKFNRRSFSRLQRAYIDARYSENYEVTEEELNWLAEQTEQLKQTVEKHCLTHIASL